MEGKAERLVGLLEAENPELVALTVLQLGEVAKSDLGLVLGLLSRCFIHKSWRLRFSAALALTQTLQSCNSPPCELDHDSLHSLSEVFTASPQPRKQPKISSPSPLSDLLKLALSRLFNRDWNSTQGSLLCLKSLLETRKVSKSTAEHCLYQVLVIIAEDKMVDYEDDAPSYPVREVAAQVIEHGAAYVDSTLLTSVLVHVAQTASNRVGALLAMGKIALETYPEAVYLVVGSSLQRSEDEATEAARLLYLLPTPPAHLIPDLCLSLLNLIAATDDLATSVQHSILTLRDIQIDRYRKAGHLVTITPALLLPFAFHKTKNVRLAVFELLLDLLPSVRSENQSDLTMIVIQGLLMETAQVHPR